MALNNHDSHQQNEQQLLARVAWLYYREELTQAEIGKKLDITRARVNRMLQICRDTGVVQLKIATRFAECVELESRLEKTYGLTRAIVAPTPVHESALYDVIGAAAGNYLSKTLRDGQALGLGWGRTLRACTNHIEQRFSSGIQIVSLFGGLPRGVTTNPYDIASQVARRLGVDESYYIAAPMFVSNEELRDLLITQEPFGQAFERAKHLDMAFVGVGDLTVKSTNVVLEALGKDEWRSLLDAGAVGELFNHFLDANGNLVDHSINNRVMSPPLDILLQIPEICVAAGGVQKSNVLRAVLSRGYVHSFITDELTARSILDNE